MNELEIMKMLVREKDSYFYEGPRYSEQREKEEVMSMKVNKSSQKGEKVQDGKEFDKKEELKFVYRVWSGYTKYIRSQVMQGRGINCIFLGKFAKRSALEASRIQVGGPKRGDQSFTTNLFGENKIQNIATSSMGYKKYCYLPSLEFLDVASLTFKEDIENQSPLLDTKKLKMLQISYSAIAAACNTRKGAVMNCLKEFFAILINLIMQGKEISLDLKIGTLHIIKDKVLMFRNYNPDIKIYNRRERSHDIASKKSSIETSVATPLTNVESTLSYRGASQDFPKMHSLNYGGFKRSGPAHEHNAEGNMNEEERIYFRDKKNPYNYLHNFIRDERFSMQSKLNQLKRNEKQKYFHNRVDHRKVLSSTFRSSKSFLDYKPSSKQKAARGELSTDHKLSMNKTMMFTPMKGNKFEKDEPSSVNDKLPSRFVIDYPKFLKPAKYYPYRRLEEHHISDVLSDARKRHEQEILGKKKEEEKYSDMFKKSVEDNKKRIHDLDNNRKKLYEDHKKSLQEQILQKRLISAMEEQERKRYFKTNYGPEETEIRAKHQLDKVSQEKDFMKRELLSQIQSKRQKTMNRIVKERAEDKMALEIIANIE
ncbi:unnamed protein product [Moneuplotes crassus]|uniref:CCDC81 HU domain-containing protein n=1 Tax=Euplotes crassus TaxID=5936 RepID=A0AAD1X853_EUPCR|nr:unnamed protein product [Moneuplotes crassus]